MKASENSRLGFCLFGVACFPFRRSESARQSGQREVIEEMVTEFFKKLAQGKVTWHISS